MLCTHAKISMGKNRIFICSQVDSLMAEMGAKIPKPVQSYRKCKIVPKAVANVNPPNCQSNKFCFMIIPLRKCGAVQAVLATRSIFCSLGKYATKKGRAERRVLCILKLSGSPIIVHTLSCIKGMDKSCEEAFFVD